MKVTMTQFLSTPRTYIARVTDLLERLEVTDDQQKKILFAVIPAADLACIQRIKAKVDSSLAEKARKEITAGKKIKWHAPSKFERVDPKKSI